MPLLKYKNENTNEDVILEVSESELPSISYNLHHNMCINKLCNGENCTIYAKWGDGDWIILGIDLKEHVTPNHINVNVDAVNEDKVYSGKQ